jgi:type I restriction enzyme S subunit
MELYKKRISDLGRIVTGKTPRTSNAQNYGGDIPFLTPSDDLSGKFAPKTIKTITGLGLSEVKNCLLPSKSVCVSCIGSDLGKVVITNEPTVTNQQFNSIIPNEENDTDYIYYLMTIVGKELNFLSKTSTAVPIINKSTFADYEIEMPSLENQRRIAKVLSSLDDKIEVNRRINDNFVIEPLFEILLIWMLTTSINDNLEQQAQALFKSWFVDFEPFRDKPFVDSVLGMIPNGWCVTVLDELCSFISRGLTPKYDESSDELILGQTCVRNNIVTLNNARRHQPKQRTEKWIQQWDTLINSTGVGSLGRVGVVYFDMDNIAIDSHITVARPKSALVRHYVGRNLLSRQLEIENMAVGSTGQTELPKDRVKSMPIVLPDDNALTRFNAVIEPVAYQLYRNIEESCKLASLRDTLLPRLMSGELSVKDIVNM